MNDPPSPELRLAISLMASWTADTASPNHASSITQAAFYSSLVACPASSLLLRLTMLSSSTTRAACASARSPLVAASLAIAASLAAKLESLFSEY